MSPVCWVGGRGWQETSLDLELHSQQLEQWARLTGDRVVGLGEVKGQATVKADQDLTIRMKGQLANDFTQLDFEGNLGRAGDYSHPSFALDLQVQDWQQLGAAVGQDHFSPATGRLEGHLKLLENKVVGENLRFQLEEHRIALDGELHLVPGYLGSRLDAAVAIVSTQAFGQLFGVTGLPDERLLLDIHLEPKKEGLAFVLTDGENSRVNLKVSGRVDSLTAPAAVQAQYDVHLPSLRLLNLFLPDSNLPDIPLTARGELTDHSKLTGLKNTEVQVGQSSFTLNAELALRKNLEGSRISIDGSGPDFSEFWSDETDGIFKQPFELGLIWRRIAGRDILDPLKLNVGELELRAEGSVDQQVHPARLDMRFALSGPDASRLAPLIRQQIPAESFSFKSGLMGTPHLFTLPDLSLSLGRSQLDFQLSVERGDVPMVSGQLESTRLDLSFWVPAPNSAADSEANTAADHSTRVFDDTPVFRPAETPIDLVLDARIDQVFLYGLEVNSVSAKIDMNRRDIRISPFSFRGPLDSSISANLNLTGLADKTAVQFDLEAKGLHPVFLSESVADLSEIPPTDLYVDVTGEGATHARLASSINGTLRIFQGPGSIANRGLNWYLGDFTTNLLHTLNPLSSGEKFTHLDCSVIAANATNGVVEVNTGLLQTSDVTIVSTGQVDLGSEIIDMGFSTRARKGLGISASELIKPFIKVGGTLKAPAIELDKTGAVVKGGTAVATAGLSLLATSLSGRFLSAKDPCGDKQAALEKEDNRRY